MNPRPAGDRRRPTRTVVITGASAGVGRACAEAFARAGWNVALIARGPDGLEGARAAAERFGATALVVPADVADSDAVDAAASRIEAELGPVGAWVNAAMVTAYSPVDRMSAAEFRRITEVVYLGTVHGTMAALRLMRERGGVIVQVGSALAYRALPLQSAYSGSKFAVRGFTEALRAELRHERSAVRVVMVQLPAVNTPQFGWALNRMERLPQPAPPIYQPEAIAAVILRAADGKARELWIGASAVKVILSSALAPGIVEVLLARLGYAAQQSSQPEPGGRPDNLVSPLPGDHGARGRFGAGARARAMVVNPDRMQLGVACVAVLGVLAAVAWQRAAPPVTRDQLSTAP